MIPEVSCHSHGWLICYLSCHRCLPLHCHLLLERMTQLFYGLGHKISTGWQRGLEGINYPRGKTPALLSRNLVIPTYRMCSPFRNREKGSSRELERGNSVRELACNNPKGSRCPGTRTDLLLFTFLLFRGRRGLRRCFPRVLSSWDTPGGVSDSVTSTRTSSGMNAFTSSRAGTRKEVKWVWRLTNASRSSLGARGTSVGSIGFILNIRFNYSGG